VGEGTSVIRGEKVQGEKKLLRGDPQALTWHWAHNEANRMYKCRCMPCFRVGQRRMAGGRRSPRQRDMRFFSKLGAMRSRLKAHP
jgi:hypothetical protein